MSRQYNTAKNNDGISRLRHTNRPNNVTTLPVRRSWLDKEPHCGFLDMQEYLQLIEQKPPTRLITSPSTLYACEAHIACHAGLAVVTDVLLAACYDALQTWHGQLTW